MLRDSGTSNAKYEQILVTFTSHDKLYTRRGTRSIHYLLQLISHLDACGRSMIIGKLTFSERFKGYNLRREACTVMTGND